MNEARIVVGDLLVLVATVLMTMAVVGIVRFRETLVRIHATSKAALLALLVTLCAALVSGDAAMMGRAALVAGFLLLTTPVSAHALARLACARAREP